MTVDEYLNHFESVFGASAAKIPNDLGCSHDNLPVMIDVATSSYPHSRYTAIEKWYWIDIDASDAETKKLGSMGLAPSLVYTENILIDNPDRFFRCVTSTLLAEFSNNSLFRTRNTTYILVGKGTRLKIPVETYIIVFKQEVELKISKARLKSN